MSKSLLFIPDISGFTNFIQTTEAEHSQHVIAELLEILIAANTQQLKLAEVEGDALFFYKENEILSQEKLLAQVETMYTAFYSHLEQLKKNRICPCMACSSASKLELKIIIHAGDLQFIEVQKNRKPFGEAVIQAHRLLKNSIKSDNYTLISKDLVTELKMPSNYRSSLFAFQEGEDGYDGKTIGYEFSIIKVEQLKLKPFQESQLITLGRKPNLLFQRTFPVSAGRLLEFITNYKYRHQWAKGTDEILYNEKEVTRIGSKHMCVIGSQHLDFKVVTKKNSKGDIVYGEVTSSPKPIDTVYQFFDIEPVNDQSSKLSVEVYLEAKSIIKKLLIFLVIESAFKKNMTESLGALDALLQEQKG